MTARECYPEPLDGDPTPERMEQARYQAMGWRKRAVREQQAMAHSRLVFSNWWRILHTLRGRRRRPSARELGLARAGVRAGMVSLEGRV